MSLPKEQLALRLHFAPKDSPKGTRHEAKVETIPIPSEPQGNDDLVLVQLQAAGFNRRDEWSLMGAYPGLMDNSIMGCDGVGVIHGDQSGKRYVINPTVGWTSAEAGPDFDGSSNEFGGKGFGILGGTKPTGGQGTFQEYIWVKRTSLIDCPDHLTACQASALPCGGVTAYRALFTKGKVSSGQNVLITGIGGGVALLALRLALAVGAKVYVTGGSQGKLDHAVSLGAVGGANYKEDGWEGKIKSLLPKDRPYLDAVIDSAGGGITGQSIKAGLKDGGKIVIFGMTAGPKVDVTMREVLKNVDIIGSTMGSLEEFKQCVQLVAKHKIVPDIDTVIDGLRDGNRGFPLLADASKRSGGKVIIKIRPEADQVPGGQSKL